jgi:molybdopterin/thiamine biosynthesis adenylyltransferase/predicted Zn-ribbon and HTH transcriptional regulator
MDERFARHHLIPEWDQQALSQAHVIIVGVGALGNEVARILAMSGVGYLLLCDHDRITVSNLSRCSLFRADDIGDLKVTAATRALQDITPHTRLDPRPLPLVQAVGLAELRAASLVISCLDSRTARLQLAGRCNLVQAPYLDGGTALWSGEVRPFLTGDVCYGCSLSETGRAISDVPWSCSDISETAAEGSTIAVSAMVAAWMSLLALRYLMHLPVSHDFFCFDGASGKFYPCQIQRDPLCPLHHPIGDSTLIAVSHQDPISQLYAALGVNQQALSYEAVQTGMQCQQCGYKESRWGVPQAALCPHCTTPLIIKTTLELSAIPDNIKLVDLGIPPREILPVRTAEGIRWVELTD